MLFVTPRQILFFTMKPARCAFYPESCAKEFHGSREPHAWKDEKSSKDVAKKVAAVANDALPTGVTNAAKYLEPSSAVLPTSDDTGYATTIKIERSGAAIRQAKWRDANREKHRELERERMRRKRAK